MVINPRAKRWLKRLGLAALVLCFLLLLLLAGLVFALNSQWGRDTITELVNEKASSETMTIRLQGLASVMPWDLRLGGLTLADPDGVWLEAEDLSVSVDVAALLDKAVVVDHITLERLEYFRAPLPSQDEKEPEPDKPISLEIPQIPPVRIDTLRVSELVLHTPPPAEDDALQQAAASQDNDGSAQLKKAKEASEGSEVKAFSINGAMRPEGKDFIVELDVRELSDRELQGEQPRPGFRPDSLNLQARLQQPGNVLAIDASLEEGSGGLAGKALGLAPDTPLSGGLQGKGSLEDWQGDLALNVGEQHLLKGRLSLRLDQEAGLFHAGLKGDLQDPAGLLPPDVVSLSGSRADYDIALSLPLDGDLQQQARLEKLQLESSTFSLNLGASMNEGQTSATLTLHVLDEAILPGLTQNALSGAPSFSASLEGNEQKLTLDLRSGLGSLSLPDLASKPATLQTTVTIASPLDASARSIAAKGVLSVDGLKPPEQYTLDEKLDLAFDLAMPSEQRVVINSLKLLNGDNTLYAKGDVDLQALQVDAEIEANLPHAAALMTLHPLDAAIELKATAKGSMEKGIEATVSGNLQQIKGLEPQLAALLGDALQLEASAFVDETVVKLHTLEVDGKTSLQAKGDYGMQGQTLDAELTLTPPATLILPGEAGGPDALKLDQLEPLALTAKGSLEKRLEVTASSGAAAVDLPGRSFSNLKLALDAGIPLTPAPEEDAFSLDISTRQVALTVSSHYQLKPETLHLRELRISGPETTINGSLQLGLENTLVTGDIDIQARRLAAYAHLLGMELAGALNASIQLSTPDNRQAAKITATGSNLAAAGADLASLKLEASTTDAFAIAQGHGSADLRLETGKAGVEAAFAESLQLTAALRQGVVNLDLQTKGQADKPFALDLKAAVTPGPQRIEARLDALSGSYAGIPLKLKAPATIVAAGEQITVKGLDMALASATVQADGVYAPKNTDLKLSLKSLQLQSLEPVAPQLPKGRVDLDLAVSGDLAAPAIKADIAAKGLEMPADEIDGPNLPPLGLQLTANINAGKLQAQGDISHPGGQLATVTAALPMQLALQPFAFELKQDATLDARVKGDFQLRMLQNILAMTDQTLDGDIYFDVAVAGQLNEPDLKGEVNLKQGRYENLKTGTLLKDIRLKLTAQGDRFEIARLSANDGLGGSISGTGGVDMADNMAFKADVTIDKLAPAHMDMFEGKLSGTINVSGNSQEGGDIVGRLKILQGEVNIPKSLPPDVANVDVIQKNDGSEPDQEQEEEEEEEAQKKEAFPLKLDIQVAFPGRFFVRGMGLDSEWGGNLQITGTAATPRIVGNLQVQRGSFEFLDKNFTIKEGKIRFSGGTPPSPVLNITTSTQARGIEAMVIISGTPQHLKINFDSNPPLPQNEILAAVLFGRSTDSLTPMQALRLARALDQISGGTTGTSLDVMQNLKGILHVDELSAGEGKSGDMTMQAGKYITDDVYLKGTKGLNPRDDSLSLEVEITPNLGLESEMGGDSQGGVGLNWRYDY